jgi:hypothetical protein
MEMFNLHRKPGQELLPITRVQWVAIQQKFSQSPGGAVSFTEFFFRVQPAVAMNCLILPW